MEKLNKKQKTIIFKSLSVIILTIAAVVGMFNFKDYVNRSEAIRAIEQLGANILSFRQEHGYLPSQSYVERIKDSMAGNVRVGKINYRGRWIQPDSGNDTILAFVEKKYDSLLFHNGVIVLRLDGRVEWMNPEDFDALLSQQRDPMEIDLYSK
jgi:hypothetical protein